MENKVSFQVASNLQRATQGYVKQNINIKAAIAALKEITHAPLPTLENKHKRFDKTPFFGLSEEERDAIRKFIDFLETKEVRMDVIFQHFISE